MAAAVPRGAVGGVFGGGGLAVGRCWLLWALMGLRLAVLAAARAPAVVVNTWPFVEAARAAHASVAAAHPHVDVERCLDALVAGCATCERMQCDGSVGYGGSPDETGETTLDALVFDGTNMRAGAVADLRNVRDAVAAARFVMTHTTHTILAGEAASDFAVSMGLARSNLTTKASAAIEAQWRASNCQPNYRRPQPDYSPDPRTSCGPYERRQSSDGTADAHGTGPPRSRKDHDTIAMVVLAGGHAVAGTSTNGASHKVPGRVGDSPVPGAGAYAVSGVGGCGATGDGDVSLRFLPCFLAVELLRNTPVPQDERSNQERVQRIACAPLARVAEHYPAATTYLALFVVDAGGTHAGCSLGPWNFTYTVFATGSPGAQVFAGLPFSAPASV